MTSQTEPQAEPRILNRADGTAIAYHHHPGKGPGVIFCGGFMSDMTGTKATALEAACAKAGRSYTRFDYRGHGQSSGRFEDGTIGTVCFGRRMPDTENDAMVYGSEGRIALRSTIWETMRGELHVASETVNLSESYEHDILTMYRLQTESFNRAVRNDVPFQASGEDGLRVVEVTSAIIESAGTGRSVKVGQV